MRLIPFHLGHYEEVVEMLHAMYSEIFEGKRKIGPKYFYYKEVMEWINSNKLIVLSQDKDGTITGFSMAYIDSCNGLTEQIFNGVHLYVKPKYRKGRSAYMLYNNGVKYAEERKLNASTLARTENGVDAMVEKHFTPEKIFINYERIYNG